MIALHVFGGVAAAGCDDDSPSDGKTSALGGSGGEHAGSGGHASTAGAGGKASGAAGKTAGSAGAGGKAAAGSSAAQDQDAGAEQPVDEDRVYAYVRGAFVNVTHTMDLADDAPELDKGKAREFKSEDPAFAGGQAIDQVDAELQQLKISDDLKWTDGPKISFAQYPLGEDGVSWFFSWRVDPHHIYLTADKTSRIVWDPTDFKILELKEDTKIPAMVEGLPLEAGGNRTSLESGDQPTQMPYFWKDDDWWKFASKSIIAQYDQKTHEETNLIEIQCPGLAVGTRDEEGYTYWSTWDYKGLVALYNMGPKPCMARITPDGKLDEDFTTDMLDWTGGKYAKKFQYVRDGWGLLMVFDHEKTGLDFSAPKAADDAIDKWWDPTYWSVYRVDLKKKTAEPYTALKNPQPINDVTVDKVGDRVFYTVIHSDWEQANMFELQKDGSVTKFSEAGDGKGFWRRVR